MPMQQPRRRPQVQHELSVRPGRTGDLTGRLPIGQVPRQKYTLFSIVDYILLVGILCTSQCVSMGVSVFVCLGVHVFVCVLVCV